MSQQQMQMQVQMQVSRPTALNRARAAEVASQLNVKAGAVNALHNGLKSFANHCENQGADRAAAKAYVNVATEQAFEHASERKNARATRRQAADKEQKAKVPVAKATDASDIM